MQPVGIHLVLIKSRMEMLPAELQNPDEDQERIKEVTATICYVCCRPFPQQEVCSHSISLMCGEVSVAKPPKPALELFM